MSKSFKYNILETILYVGMTESTIALETLIEDIFQLREIYRPFTPFHNPKFSFYPKYRKLQIKHVSSVQITAE